MPEVSTSPIFGYSNYRNRASRAREGIPPLNDDTHCGTAKCCSPGQVPQVSKIHSSTVRIRKYTSRWQIVSKFEKSGLVLQLAGSLYVIFTPPRNLLGREEVSYAKVQEFSYSCANLLVPRAGPATQSPFAKSSYSLLQTEFSNFSRWPAKLCTMLSKCIWYLRGYEVKYSLLSLLSSI